MSPGATLVQETDRFADKPAASLSTEELSELEQNAQTPYRVEDVILMSPGHWNNINWEQSEIEAAADRTKFGTKEKNNALYLDHDDEDAAKWVGRVENISMEGEDLKGDLVVVDKETAVKLEFGAKFGISPKVTGRTDGRTMRDFRFDNFSVVVDPAVKTTFINKEIFGDDEDGETEELSEDESTEELAQHAVHEPEFSDSADREWNAPDMEDFDTDDLSEIDDHFIVSKSGFPPEKFSDLALPVVEPDGTLNLNALQNAKARAGQVEGLSGDDLGRVESIINRLANENFEDADFEGSAHGEEEEEMSEDDDEPQEEVEEDDGDDAEEAEDVNDTSVENDGEDNIMGENSMTEEEETPEVQEDSVENEEETTDQSVDVDVESLAQEVAKFLQDDGEEEAEEEEAPEEEEAEEEMEEDDGEDEVAAADFDGFQEYAEAAMSENPDLSLAEAAEMYEEENRSVEERFEEMSSKIDDLREEIERKDEELSEVKEKAENPQRLSKNTGEDAKSAKEKVQELSDDDLDSAMMRDWLNKAGVRLDG